MYAILGARPVEDWILAYEQSHQHPVNRACHLVGIPLIAGAIPLLAAGIPIRGLRRLGLPLFATGWVFQIIGHVVEGKPPEFFKDWRFLLIGLRWWLATVCSGDPLRRREY